MSPPQVQDPLHKKNESRRICLVVEKRRSRRRTINIFETRKNYFDHIIKKETLENAYKMIDFLLWIPQFCCRNKGTRNMLMITHVFKEKIRKK